MTALGSNPAVLTPVDRELGATLLDVRGVRAVFLGGSRASGLADAASDTDLYALHTGDFPEAFERATILARMADGGEVTEETAWGAEDHLRVGGRAFEIVYLAADALGVAAFYDPGVAPNGYTTAFLNTLANGVIIEDPHGDLAALQATLAHYPEATRARIIEQALRELPEYVNAVRKAQTRQDWTGVRNRVAAFQSAWFDGLFAINRRYHPGEKRLVDHGARCSWRIPMQGARWDRIAFAAPDDRSLPGQLAALASDLRVLLAAAG